MHSIYEILTALTLKNLEVGNTMFDEWFENKAIPEKKITRSIVQQKQVDLETSKMAFYHYETCMFCARVKSTIQSLNLSIETRDVHLETSHMQELITKGGKPTVPCLRIDYPGNSESRWLYESNDIKSFLLQKFAVFE